MEPMPSIRKGLVVAAVLIAAIGAAWLGIVQVTLPPPVIDGYPIGLPAQCGDTCARATATASGWLDASAPRHAPVERIELFDPDYRDANGNYIIADGSGGHAVIAVIHLADGTVRAIQVTCGIGIDPNACITSAPMKVANP